MYVAHPIEPLVYSGGLNRIANRPNANKNGNSPLAHPLLHSDSPSALFRTKKILAFFRSLGNHMISYFDYRIINYKQDSINQMYFVNYCIFLLST